MNNGSEYTAVANDASAVLLSSLCMVHCLLIPALAATGPIATVWLEQEWIHQLLVLVALPVSGYAIRVSIAAGESRWFAYMAGIGLALLFAAAFIPSLHDFEVLMTVSGATVLAASHVLRWFRRHQHMC